MSELNETRGAISIEELRALVRYDAVAGRFYWNQPMQNGRIPEGTLAGWKQRGTWALKLKGQTYVAARLAWFYSYGKWPEGRMVHRNGECFDFRLANLIDGDETLANQNTQGAANKSNPLGVLGVHKSKKRESFTAYGRLNGKSVHIGCYKTLEEAEKAALAYRKANYKGFTL